MVRARRPPSDRSPAATSPDCGPAPFGSVPAPLGTGLARWLTGWPPPSGAARLPPLGPVRPPPGADLVSWIPRALPSRLLFELGQPGLSPPAGRDEASQVDLGLRANSGHDELFADLPVERTPWTAASSRAQLTEPVGSFHRTAVRVGQPGAEGCQLCLCVDERRFLFRHQGVTLQDRFGQIAVGPHGSPEIIASLL